MQELCSFKDRGKMSRDILRLTAWQTTSFRREFLSIFVEHLFLRYL